MILAGQPNLWFRPGDANYRNPDGTPATWLVPHLGEIDSSDWQAWRRYLQSLKNATGGQQGFNLAAGVQWIQPHDRIDSNLGVWLWHAVQHVVPEMSWYIFYDPVLALRQRAVPVDFRNSDARNLIRSDIQYLTRWTSHAQYLHIEKPVVMIWAMGVLPESEYVCREFTDAGWFVIADMLGTQKTDQQIARFRSSVGMISGFVSKMPITPKRQSTIDATKMVVAECNRFRQLGFDVMPSTSIQYDDTFSSRGQNLQTLARSREEIEDAILLLTAEPLPYNMVWLGTWDNWPESTSILATRRVGPKYLKPGADGLPPHVGNYRRDILRAIRKIWSEA